MSHMLKESNVGYSSPLILIPSVSNEYYPVAFEWKGISLEPLLEFNPRSRPIEGGPSRDTDYFNTLDTSSTPLENSDSGFGRAIRNLRSHLQTRRHDLDEKSTRYLQAEEWIDLQDFVHTNERPEPTTEKHDSSRRLPTHADIMKFSHSLQFNAVPDWSTHYIAYSNLKKLIYTLEKQTSSTSNERTSTNVESSPLLSSRYELDPDAAFRAALDGELKKVCSFYVQEERDLYDEAAEITEEYQHYINDTDNLNPQDDTLDKIQQVPNSPSQAQSSFLQEFRGGRRRLSNDTRNATAASDDDSDVDANSIRVLEESTGHTVDPRLSDLFHRGVMLKKRMIGIYVSLCELKSYVLLNKTGFSKALKKFDKTLDRSLKREYMNVTVSKAYPFTEAAASGLDAQLT
ncbi:low-affinity phosphate transporter, partial [Ascosphaera aggregata]